MSTKKIEKKKYTPNQVIWYHTILWMLPAIVCFFIGAVSLHNYAALVEHPLLDSCDVEFENLSHEECVTRNALMDAQMESRYIDQTMISLGFGVLFTFIAVTYNHHNRFMR